MGNVNVNVTTYTELQTWHRANPDSDLSSVACAGALTGATVPELEAILTRVPHDPAKDMRDAENRRQRVGRLLLDTCALREAEQKALETFREEGGPKPAPKIETNEAKRIRAAMEKLAFRAGDSIEVPRPLTVAGTPLECRVAARLFGVPRSTAQRLRSAEVLSIVATADSVAKLNTRERASVLRHLGFTQPSRPVKAEDATEGSDVSEVFAESLTIDHVVNVFETFAGRASSLEVLDAFARIASVVRERTKEDDSVPRAMRERLGTVDQSCASIRAQVIKAQPRAA